MAKPSIAIGTITREQRDQADPVRHVPGPDGGDQERLEVHDAR